jgi:hypothetical protein
MKLETEFVKLPLLFDAERLKEEIVQFSEDEWMAHTTGYAGNLSIPLISLDGEFNDAMHGPMKATSALDRCEYIQQIMTSFDEVFGRSRLMRLEPGHEVPPHIDVNYHWYNRVRIHIPITTTEDVLFYCNDQHVHMAAGECWIFNSWLEHTVKNNSDRTRVHLVLDTAGSTRFWDLVERGDWPFKVGQQPVSEPKLVQHVPNNPTRIRTETFNVPLVQGPGELENLIKDLADDIDCSNDSEVKGAQVFVEQTKNFIRAWREVWSEHGMMPSGWPRYHDLSNKIDEAVFAISPELVLESNGIELAQAFRSLVLSSAINEEFAPQYLDKDQVPDKLKKIVRSYTSEQKESKDSGEQVARNAPCPCGSGERYKYCHGRI